MWLVSLLTYCPKAPQLQKLLGRVQQSLGLLLGDSNELTQVWGLDWFKSVTKHLFGTIFLYIFNPVFCQCKPCLSHCRQTSITLFT